MNEFKDREEYLEWCAKVVDQLYIASTVPDREWLRFIMDNIRSTLRTIKENKDEE